MEDFGPSSILPCSSVRTCLVLLQGTEYLAATQPASNTTQRNIKNRQERRLAEGFLLKLSSL